ncbi:hypothetical protein GQX73_g10148 [Xylaria multiplex]|uniref:Uncharacterized protein n=1 Tax=Xylaria multiplex TaxID=323545 RepID=A0A7C8ILJ2_9PEZI|nr:hypothetical protein GQX73_g10148 [Xylaria multiplex]
MRGRKRSRKTREQDPRMSLRAICAPSSLSQIAPPIPPTVEKLACLSSQDVDTLLHEWGRAGVVTAYKCGADERGANNHIFKVLEAGGCRLTNVFGGLETSTGRNDGMCLWKWSLALFGTHPHDLFSWGLRYSTYDWDHGKILEGLCAILPHSVWNHDIANLRFALQMAVYLRIKDHVLPIGPLPKPIRDGILEYYTDDSLLAARVAFDAWQRLRFQSEDAISRLVAKMKELPRGQDPPQIFFA